MSEEKTRTLWGFRVQSFLHVEILNRFHYRCCVSIIGSTHVLEHCV